MWKSERRSRGLTAIIRLQSCCVPRLYYLGFVLQKRDLLWSSCYLRSLDAWIHGGAGLNHQLFLSYQLVLHSLFLAITVTADSFKNFDKFLAVNKLLPHPLVCKAHFSVLNLSWFFWWRWCEGDQIHTDFVETFSSLDVFNGDRLNI